MTNNTNTQTTKNTLCDNIDNELDCLYCGKEATPFAFSKYYINPELHGQDIYICDDCPSIFVIEDQANGQVTRQELSKDYVREDNILKF